MSGTQGRFPPAMPPPQPGWPPVAPAAAQHPAAYPAAQHTSPQAPNTQPPAFPPRYAQQQSQQQPPSLPGGSYPDPRHGQSADPYGAQAAWSPAPPAPFPTVAPNPPTRPVMPPPVPQHVPQPPQHQAYVYPPQPPAEPRRAPDSAAYDLGSYGLSATQPGMPPPITGRDGRVGQPAPQPLQQQPPQQQWEQPQNTDPYGYQGQPQPQLQQPAQSPQPGYSGNYGYQQQQAHPQQANQPQGGHQQLGHHPGQQQQQAEYDDEAEVEEPPRRRRRWLIAVALIGSIGVGSGMAYAYKMFLGPKGGDKSVVVRASRESPKAAPNERGGKQIANQDSRVLNGGRLPSEGNAVAAGGDTSSGYTNGAGVRIVQSVPVPSGAVPGMTIVGPGNGPGGGQPPIAEAPRGGGMPIPSLSAQQPQMQPPAQPRVAAAPAPPRPPVVKNQPDAEPVRQAAVAVKPPAAEQPARPKAIGGVVAALGYHKSQLDAMKMMADLQQKYDVLRDKKLEIVQSDQTSRGLGTIYRVVVGPRGSAAAAQEVCKQLFAAGMGKQGCYPLPE